MAKSQDNNPKEAKTKSYIVTTRKGFSYPSRMRAGLNFIRGGDTNVSLTQEQVKLIKEDPELELREAGKKEKQTDEDPNAESLAQAKGSPSGNHTNVKAGYNGPGQVPANPDLEDTTSEDPQNVRGSSKGSPKAQGGEKNLSKLLKANNRDKLLSQAHAAGVEVADDATKKQIAEALLANPTAPQE